MKSNPEENTAGFYLSVPLLPVDQAERAFFFFSSFSVGKPGSGGIVLARPDPTIEDPV